MTRTIVTAQCTCDPRGPPQCAHISTLGDTSSPPAPFTLFPPAIASVGTHPHARYHKSLLYCTLSHQALPKRTQLREAAPTYTLTIVHTPYLRVVQVTLFMAFALILNTTVTKVLCRIGNRSGTRGGVISGERGVIKLFDSECGVIFH